MIYKIYQTITGTNAILKLNDDASMDSFLLNLENPDYQNFKLQINSEKAKLQDVDGNEMTAQQAKDFVKELP